jgi:2-dehydro-3-deoxyphosphooctonate aldolase (KDO 8-P synthase)
MDFSQFFCISGPCVVESREMLFRIAEELVALTEELQVQYIFKASYRKANRSSVNSFTGIGDEEALRFLDDVKQEFQVPILTDIHEAHEVEAVAQVADVLQIPAFLCRQTDLLVAAGKSGRTVNIKKGQFLAAEDMQKAVSKVESTGNNSILVTERGTMFGYRDLVVDFRSLVTMQQTKYPVVYDATHSVQMPGLGTESGGKPEYILPLARAAIATGIQGLFFETHPNPAEAKSDSATQLPLSEAGAFLREIMRLQRFMEQ